MWLKQGQQGESRRSTKASKAQGWQQRWPWKNSKKWWGMTQPASTEECIFRTNSTGVWSWVRGTVRQAERSPRSSWLVGRENLLSVDLQNPGRGEWDAWPRISNYAQHIKCIVLSVLVPESYLLSAAFCLPHFSLFPPGSVCWLSVMVVLVTQEM